MKKIYIFITFLFTFLWCNINAQTCGVVYGAGYAGAGSSIGVRSYDFTTNTFSATSLINTTLFTAPNTMNNGGPIAIDPLNQNINFITDATSPRQAALFNFASSTINFVPFPAALDAAVGYQVFCSGYKPLSHQCYYMTGNFLSTTPTPASSAFFKIDFTNTAAPTYQLYTPVLSPGSPLVNINDGSGSAGADLCFDANDIGYMVTGSKQLFRINPDDVSGNATFTYLAQMNSLTFTPTAVAFNPINSVLVITGATQTVAEYNLATNTVTNLTTTAGYAAPDLASCFFPNINANLQITKTFYDVTQSLPGPGVAVLQNDIIEYTVTTKNNGNVNAGGFTIIDAIPSGTTYIAGSTTLNGNPVVDATGSTFPYQTAAPASSNDYSNANGILTTNTTVGAPVSVIKYRVRVVAASGTITNTVTAGVAGIDPNVPLTATTSVAFTIGSVLPIKLVSFTASKENTNSKLKWITENSSTENYFDIEHSTTGNDFVKLNRVVAQQSTGSKVYTFIDDKVKNEINYYRLKMVDQNGQINYSETREVRFDKNNSVQIQVFPNPVFKNSDINIVITNNYVQATVRITNSIGMLMQQYFFNKNHTIIINTTNLNSGVYFVETIIDNKKSKTDKLIIQ
jgi:uncharacterized repeat protein (TIGR01451 family)